MKGDNLIWYMNGLSRLSSAQVPSLADPGWEIASVGEFGVSATDPFPPSDPSQRRPDILWRHTPSGQVVIWYMTGPTLQEGYEIGTVADTNWKVVATGDFGTDAAHADLDGKRDILWHHQASGQLVIWYMSGHAYTGAFTEPPAVSDTAWKIAGAGDFNGDARTDIVWRHEGANQIVIWLMNGNALIAGQFTNPAAEAAPWRIVAPK